MTEAGLGQIGDKASTSIEKTLAKNIENLRDRTRKSTDRISRDAKKRASEITEAYGDIQTRARDRGATPEQIANIARAKERALAKNRRDTEYHIAQIRKNACPGRGQAQGARRPRAPEERRAAPHRGMREENRHDRRRAQDRKRYEAFLPSSRGLLPGEGAQPRRPESVVLSCNSRPFSLRARATHREPSGFASS